MKKNFHKIMEEEIKKIKLSGKKPSLLLHVCCAPCSSAVIEILKDFFEITLFFYNPNISPQGEFEFRLKELERLLSEMHLENIKIYVPQYNESEFIDISAGLENVPEGGARCEKCYKLRMEETFKYAFENKFDYVTTTLTVSPYKNAELLNSIGMELEKMYGVKYLKSDFKKNDGYKRSCELSRQYNLYRQNYCGCVFSKNIAESKRA